MLRVDADRIVFAALETTSVAIGATRSAVVLAATKENLPIASANGRLRDSNGLQNARSSRHSNHFPTKAL
jgi:hypothetical protein